MISFIRLAPAFAKARPSALISCRDRKSVPVSTGSADARHDAAARRPIGRRPEQVLAIGA
jgi:hypothetical protein